MAGTNHEEGPGLRHVWEGLRGNNNFNWWWKEIPFRIAHVGGTEFLWLAAEFKIHGKREVLHSIPNTTENNKRNTWKSGGFGRRAKTNRPKDVNIILFWIKSRSHSSIPWSYRVVVNSSVVALWLQVMANSCVLYGAEGAPWKPTGRQMVIMEGLGKLSVFSTGSMISAHNTSPYCSQW